LGLGFTSTIKFRDEWKEGTERGRDGHLSSRGESSQGEFVGQGQLTYMSRVKIWRGQNKGISMVKDIQEKGEGEVGESSRKKGNFIY